ncbi:MAG: protoglobin domain-containing protein [bacterium]|nr:protoglobin domain-containing protein [bacterium]
MNQIEQFYNFSSQDSQNLQRLIPIMEQYKDQLTEVYYNSLLRSEDTAKFLPNEESINKQKKTLAVWFMALFNGIYDNRYLQNIQQIGSEHVKIGMESHFINSSVYMVREFVNDIINKHFIDPEERYELSKSFGKILDINLDIMSSSYHQEELKKAFLSYRLEHSLIRLAERFSYGLNLFLVIALMGLSFGIMGIFTLDIWKLVTETQHGIINVLGTLLMLWVMIELMNTEIKHLKKGKFSITIFVEVALVAFIRDALVSSLEHGEILKQVFLVSTILVLGIVYWLISKADEKK